jgi:hypothetical protein
MDTDDHHEDNGIDVDPASDGDTVDGSDKRRPLPTPTGLDGEMHGQIIQQRTRRNEWRSSGAIEATRWGEGRGVAICNHLG